MKVKGFMQITITAVNRRDVLFTPAHIGFTDNNFNDNTATHDSGKILLNCLQVVPEHIP